MLRATYEHPLAQHWARPGGPWSTESLDDVLEPTSEHDRHVAAVAGGLQAAGVGAGAVVCWQLPNGTAADVLFRASWRLGATAAPIHHLASPTDAAAIVARLRPAVVIDAGSAMPIGPPVPRRTGSVDPATVAVALGTSGSTGTPKVALHTHRSLVYKAKLMVQTHQLDHRDCVLLPVPMAHISGLLNGVLITVGGVRVVPMAKWDPPHALRLIEQERVTFMVGPPTFFISMLAEPAFSPEVVRSMRQVSCGGAGVTEAFAAHASAAFDCRVKRSYGSTEAPTITTSTLDDPIELAWATDGRPVGDVELRVVDPATGGSVGGGEPGELWVRGPELFAGYDDQDATAAAFAPDGWFRTGDLATLEPSPGQGSVTIVGRLKDVIIRGGENVSTSEIEGVLEAHPAVVQAVAVGYPDERLGERVSAYVVTSDDFSLDDCRRWFEQRGVTRFKWPERLERLDALPLLPTGKPDRTALRTALGA